MYGQYTEQYGGYGGLVTLTGVTTVIEGSALKSADSGDGGLLTAGTVVQSAQDGIIGWGRWASASCAGFSCDGDDIVDLHYVTGRATPDLAALGGISATYSLSGATTPTSSGGAPGGAVSGTLLADFTSYTADLDLGVTVSAVTFNVSGSGAIHSGTAAFAGSFDSCSGCGSTPNGSFHGFFAGPAAERAGVAGLCTPSTVPSAASTR